jgi:DNA replication protein DnaC
MEKLNELDQLIYNNAKSVCNECLSFETCKQSLIGYETIIIYDDIFDKEILSNRKCYKYRGSCNDERVRHIKYKVFESYNKPELLKALQEEKCIYISGKVGLGKSHFLYYTANGYNERGKSVYIAHIQDIVEFVLNCVKTNEPYGGLINDLKNVDVLCLDDLGNEAFSDFIISTVLQPVINHRYLNEKITVVSSNYKYTELLNVYSKKSDSMRVAPIISRLGTYEQFQMENKNWRKK